MANDLYNSISMFDAEYYLETNPLLAAALEEAGVSAQVHYYLHGAAESAEGGVDGEFRLPNAWFDIDFYRTTKTGLEDVPANELLAHFALHGSKELLAPNPAYADEDGKLKVAELAAYLEANPGVKEAVAEMTGTPVGAELTSEQASIAAFHFFTYGIEDGLSGGIADIKPVNPIVPDETDTLTEALANLKAAQEAKTDFLKEAGENETLAENQDLDEDSTTADVEAAITAEYSETAGVLDTATGVTNFGDRAASFQDAAIAETRTDLEKDVTTKTAAAANGMTALLNGVDGAVEALEGKLKAEFVASKAYSEEVDVFDALNTVAIGTSDNDLNFVGDEFGVITSGAISTVYATKVNGQWKLNAAGEAEELVRIDSLFAKKAANEAATADSASEKEALEAAVGKVLLAENGGYSIKELGVGVIGGATPSANPKVTVDLEAVGTKIYETKADALAGDGKAEVFTVKFAGAASSDGSTIAVDFDGVSIALAQNDTASGIATKVAFGTFPGWTVAAVGDTVTFTAIAPGAATNPKAADFVIADDGSDGTASVANVTVITQGVAAGTTIDNAKAPLAEELSVALTELQKFNKSAAEFENARELNDGLEGVNEAVTDATNAITDSVEDGGLGINLLDSTTFTAANDVYLFEEGADVSLTNFGASGEDSIFFGEGFTLKQITGDIADGGHGDVNALEILWKQVGNNVELYVEEFEFAGTGSGTADLTKVTLVGVNGSDLQDNLDNGLLSLGDFVA